MMAMSTPIIDHAPPSRGLLDQPNEILHMIIGLLPTMIEFVKFVDEDGIKRNVSQYLVLAQVCRRLRRIVLAADFWQRPDFDFSDLVSDHEAERPRPRPGQVDYGIALRGLRAGGLMKALLEDEELLNNFKRKKAWSFSENETLLMAMMSGSWFSQSIESLYLNLRHGEMLPALWTLRSCHQIKRLEITMISFGNKPTQMDLDLIPKCLPRLRRLKIDFQNFKGSLEGIENLTDLLIVCTEGPFELSNWSPWSPCVLPLTSRSTLRSLTLFGLFGLSDGILNNFSNLTHVTCESVEKTMIMTLRKLTNVQLHSLRLCVTIGEDIVYLGKLWSSKCLSKLKRLHLRFECCDRWFTLGDEMQAISQHVMNSGISRLQTLEHLKFEGGFDVVWCPRLGSLKRLKCLQLLILKKAIGRTVGEQFYGIQAFPQLDCLKGCLESWTKADGLIAILKREFEVLPKIKISYVDDLAIVWEFIEDDNCLCGEDGENLDLMSSG